MRLLKCVRVLSLLLAFGFLGGIQPDPALPEARAKLPSVRNQLAGGRTFGISTGFGKNSLLPPPSGSGACRIVMPYFYVCLQLLGGVPARPSSAIGRGKTSQCTYPTGLGPDLWHQRQFQPFANPACIALSLGPDRKCAF
jgi:hypothetical protein